MNINRLIATRVSEALSGRSSITREEFHAVWLSEVLFLYHTTYGLTVKTLRSLLQEVF